MLQRKMAFHLKLCVHSNRASTECAVFKAEYKTKHVGKLEMSIAVYRWCAGKCSSGKNHDFKSFSHVHVSRRSRLNGSESNVGCTASSAHFLTGMYAAKLGYPSWSCYHCNLHAITLLRPSSMFKTLCGSMDHNNYRVLTMLRDGEWN